MPKSLLILFFVLLMYSCRQNFDAIEGKIWYPVKIEGNDYTTSLGLYAFEFGSDGTLTTYTLGTEYKISSTYNRTGNEITLNTGKDSHTVTFTVSKSNLAIDFDSMTTVHYTDMLMGSSDDLTEELDRTLVSKSWQLDSNLIEFHERLDKGLIKPELHEELNSARVHFSTNNYYNRHEDFAWGTNYFNGINFLVFGNTTGVIENQYFIIQSVSDTLISGYMFDRDGQLQNIQLSAVVSRDLKPAIISNWNISSFEEISSDFNEYWNIFGAEEGITESDLENKSLSFNFSSDSSFQFLAGNEIISKGNWYSDISGNVIYLKAEFEDQKGVSSHRTTFLSLISLNETELVIHKKEDLLQESRDEFERKEYIEAYKKLVTVPKNQ